jgi:hypothetical protein
MRIAQHETVELIRRERKPMADRAYLVVRAVVADPADRPTFDRWFADEHLPEASKAFGAPRAWRARRCTDPAVHCTFCSFDSVAAAEAIPQAGG